MSVAISQVLIHREYSRLPQSSLASLAHLADQPVRVRPLLPSSADLARVLHIHPRGVVVVRANHAQRARSWCVAHRWAVRSLSAPNRGARVQRAVESSGTRDGNRRLSRTVVVLGAKRWTRAVHRAQLAWFTHIHLDGAVPAPIASRAVLTIFERSEAKQRGVSFSCLLCMCAELWLASLAHLRCSSLSASLCNSRPGKSCARLPSPSKSPQPDRGTFRSRRFPPRRTSSQRGKECSRPVLSLRSSCCMLKLDIL